MTPNMRTEYLGHDPSKTEWVTVPDRDEPGKIIHDGMNLGGPHREISCYLLYFESTGEVCAYAKSKCDSYNPTASTDS